MGNTSQYFHWLMIKQSKPKTFWYLWLILIGCSEFGPSVVLCNPPGRMLQVFVAYGKLHFQVHLRYQQKNIYLAFKELQVAAWACHRCSQMFTMFDKYAPSDPQKTSGFGCRGSPGIPTLCRQPQLTCVMRCGNLSRGSDVWSFNHPLLPKFVVALLIQLARSRFFFVISF